MYEVQQIAAISWSSFPATGDGAQSLPLFTIFGNKVAAV
jgi:hypothetical protein